MSNPSQNKFNKQHVLTNNLLTGLQLLGFDVSSNEGKAKTSFNFNLFSKPNSKVFEVIVHFLLSQLDAEKAAKVFDTCWPVVLPEQQKEFKEAVLTWLNDLAKTPPNKQSQQSTAKHQNILHSIKIPPTTKSLITSPSGIKLVELLFALLQYVLLSKLLKISEAEKLDTRVWPKVALEHKLPFSSSNLNTIQSKQSIQKNAAIKSQLEIQADSQRRQIEIEFNELNEFAAKCVEIKTKWREYST